MSGFLDNYGVSDMKRERGLKRILLAAVLLLIVGFGGYWFFHDFRERRTISRFLTLLGEKNYEDAYRLWGCDPAKPCRDYNFARFMEDWGPKSPHASVAAARVRRTRSCDAGVIQIIEFKPGDEVLLYVDRQQRAIGFSPFEYCVDASGRNTKLLDIFFR